MVTLVLNRMFMICHLHVSLAMFNVLLLVSRYTVRCTLAVQAPPSLPVTTSATFLEPTPWICTTSAILIVCVLEQTIGVFREVTSDSVEPLHMLLLYNVDYQKHDFLWSSKIIFRPQYTFENTYLFSVQTMYAFVFVTCTSIVCLRYAPPLNRYTWRPGNTRKISRHTPTLRRQAAGLPDLFW